jgi:hypothetical protein
MNTRTARSQLMGGMIWAIGQALHGATGIDRRYARYVNRDLQDYLVPVNADIKDLHVTLVPEVDHAVYPTGIKALGELAMSALPPQSPARSTTRRANASATCRSGLSNFSLEDAGGEDDSKKAEISGSQPTCPRAADRSFSISSGSLSSIAATSLLAALVARISSSIFACRACVSRCSAR